MPRAKPNEEISFNTGAGHTAYKYTTDSHIGGLTSAFVANILLLIAKATCTIMAVNLEIPHVPLKAKKHSVDGPWSWVFIVSTYVHHIPLTETKSQVMK